MVDMIGGAARTYAASDTNTDTSTNNNSGSSSDTIAGYSSDLANEQVFMRLLVEQLKNQDPLNPMDGTQFVAQLAQFSELEQVIGIHQDVGKLIPATPPATSN